MKNGHLSQIFQRPGWLNQAMKSITKSRKIIRIWLKIVFQMQRNRKLNNIPIFCFPNTYIQLGMNWSLALPKLADIKLFLFGLSLLKLLPTQTNWRYYPLKFPILSLNVIYPITILIPNLMGNFFTYYQSWSPKPTKPILLPNNLSEPIRPNPTFGPSLHRCLLIEFTRKSYSF